MAIQLKVNKESDTLNGFLGIDDKRRDEIGATCQGILMGSSKKTEVVEKLANAFDSVEEYSLALFFAGAFLH